MKKVPVRLGLMSPLTGIVSLYGDEISEAAKIACEEINEQGGVLGHPLELIIEDDGSLPEKSVPAARKLVEEHGCVAIIGNLLSNSRISVSNHVSEPLGIPYLNFSFYEGSISSRYFFHFAALPNQQIEKMIPYMMDMYGPKVFFAGNNYEWPRGSIASAKSILTGSGGEVVGEEYFDIGTNDFSDLLMAVSRSGADFFVPYAAGTDQINLLTQFTNAGLKKKMAVVMGHYDEAMVSGLTPEVREGFYSINTYFMSVDSRKNREYLERLSRRTGVNGIWPAGNGILTNFGEGTYLCVHAFARAAEAAGSFDREKITDALETVEVSGPQGIVTMDSKTHHATVNSYLSKCNAKGEFIIKKSFGRIAPKIPERYSDSFSRLNKKKITAVRNASQGKHLIGIINFQENGHVINAIEAISNISTVDNSVLTEGAILELFAITEMKKYELIRAARDHESVRFGADLPIVYLPPSICATPLYNKGVCTHFALYIEESTKNKELHSGIKEYGDESVRSAHGAMIIDNTGVIDFVDGAIVEFLGYESEQEIRGLHINQFIDDAPEFRSIVKSVGKKELWQGKVKVKNKKGKYIHVGMYVEQNIHNDEIKDGYILVFGNRLFSEDSQSRAIFEKADVALIVTDIDGNIVQFNQQAATLFGYSGEEMLGLSIHLLVPPNLRRQHEFYFEEFVRSDVTEKSMGTRSDISGYRKDGTFFPAEASIVKHENPDGLLIVATVRDISDRKATEEELLWKATHDPLTRLPNRNLIQDRLQNALTRSARSGSMVILMFIDLDEFKVINDNYGHEMGDKIIVTISNRLLDIMRPGDTVARFGGDEFLILCDQVDSEEAYINLADRVVDSIKKPIHLDGNDFYMTTSIGICTNVEKNITAEQMLQNADAAMYAAKQNGRDGWRNYDYEIGENTRQHLYIANGLRTALENNEMEVYFQPIVDCRTLEIKGAESLLRWNRNGQYISPAIFIPVAEMTGSIIPIGYWVFEESCRQQALLSENYGEDYAPYISVNLSAAQLTQKMIVEEFHSILKRTRANPEKIVIEVTESTLMIDVDNSLKILRSLGDIGLSLAIDDFGTGHSSLSRIKSLPVDIIKVDRAFVHNLHEDDGNFAISSAVIQMAHALGLSVTAEGVELKEELLVLKKLGCDSLQGYLFDKPLSCNDFTQSIDMNLTGYKIAI